MKQHKTLSIWLFVLIYCIVIAVCVALDQITKLLIFDKLLEANPGNGIDVIGKFLRFYALYNSGASFGMGQSDAANIVFFVITVVGIPAFAFLLWRSRKRSVCGQVGYAMVIGGTIGNAIDRCFVATTEGKFFSGQVRDFISFSIFPPVFNIADSFLVIGVFLILLAVLFLDPDGLLKEIKKQKAQKTAQEGETQDGAPNSAAEQTAVENTENIAQKTVNGEVRNNEQNALGEATEKEATNADSENIPNKRQTNGTANNKQKAMSATSEIEQAVVETENNNKQANEATEKTRGDDKHEDGNAKN